ncbi:2B19 protein, partial [Hippolais icterina]|nr:2B19 protein [Hippolais icterina]
LCPAHSGVFQFMGKFECHFINGMEKVRFMHRYIYNREQIVMFDSDVGHYVGFTPLGEKWARDWNSNPVVMERQQTAVDIVCRPNYKISVPFIVDRRVPPQPTPPLPSLSQ